jgi:ABC-type branched-subunit amino acid transport system substrate-binding protein
MNRKRILRQSALAVITAVALTGYASSASLAKKASSPIHVMAAGLLTPVTTMGGLSYPFGATGVQAAAAAINAKGGIDGHKLVVNDCDLKGDPNVAVTCGREAASDRDIAVLGTFAPVGAPQLLAVLQSEHIPYIGGLPTSTQELNSTDSFQFDPGPNLSGYALAALWVQNGCKRVADIIPANPVANAIEAQQNQLAAKLGFEISTQIVPPGVADVTPIVSAAEATNPNCFTYSGDGQTNVKYIIGLRQTGFTGKIITSEGSLTPEFLPSLGSAGNGVIALSSTLLPNSNDPMVVQFRNDLREYLKGNTSEVSQNLNEYAQDGWSSVQLLKDALSGATSFTAKTLLKKIPTMCNVNVGNVYPHVDFCKAVAKSTVYTRVHNDEWQFYVDKNGQYVPSSGGKGWHNDADTIPR